MSETIKRQMAQGDVLLVPVGAVPTGAVRRSPTDSRYILALGEATGHHHSIAEAAGVAVLDAPDGAVFVTVDPLSEAVLMHQEHGPHTLLPGAYRVLRQREYTPWGERQVAD